MMRATRMSVIVFRRPISDMMEGPVILRVAANERLISVTVALLICSLVNDYHELICNFEEK